MITYNFEFFVRPSFSATDSDTENDAKNRSSIFQIATREFVFIVDMKDLFSDLSQSVMEQFVNEILFNENLIKLGSSFIKDKMKYCKRLLISACFF